MIYKHKVKHFKWVSIGCTYKNCFYPCSLGLTVKYQWFPTLSFDIAIALHHYRFVFTVTLRNKQKPPQTAPQPTAQEPAQKPNPDGYKP